MAGRTTVPPLDRIRDNPTLYPLAFRLVRERFPALKWHSHADDPRSSQAFALSAFVPLLALEDRDTIIERFVTGVFPRIPHKETRLWTLVPEFVDRDLLGETGAGIATNVDALLMAEDVVICVESKFIVDAAEGFGRCSQASKGTCLGYHGAGSDTRGTAASCRLTIKDGRRDPRCYWELGRGHFRDEVFAEQTPSQVCPYRDTYQLMRNYLTASELARRDGKPYFGAIGIAPSGRSSVIREGVQRFVDDVLLPENRNCVAAVAYEDYLALLEDGSREANSLAAFLRALL
jgi:hypothetical protein